MQDRMESLMGLGSAALHDVARQRGRDLAGSRWEVAVCLLAIELRGVHLEHDCASAAQYAERFLSIEAYTAVEMLRVAKALELLPELSEAFRIGQISWTSIREITRRADAGTDAEWADIGRRLTTAEIQRLCVRSPRAWEQEQKAEARGDADEQPALFDARAVAEPAPMLPESVPAPQPAAGGTQESRHEIVAGAPAAPVAASARTRSQTVSCEARPDNTPSTKPATLPGGQQPRVGLEFRLTPDLYELYKALESRVRAQRRGTMTREQVFEQVCRRALSGDGTKTRTRTIVVLHYDPQTRAAWTETDRGLMPIAPETAEAAMQTGRVVVAPVPGSQAHRLPESPPADLPCTDISAPKSQPEHRPPPDAMPAPREEASAPTLPSKQEQPPHTQPPACRQNDAETLQVDHKRPAEPATLDSRSDRPRRRRRSRGRRRLTAATMTALYARSNGRCEQCGRSSYLHVHHRTPTSRGGADDLDDVRLLCSTCHGASHHHDFADDPAWSAARQRAQTLTLRRKAHPAAQVGATSCEERPPG